MSTERHPDDLPPMRGGGRPELRSAGQGLPRGVAWAIALAVVVLAIASWMALRTDTGDQSEPTPVEALLDQVEGPGETVDDQAAGGAEGSAAPTATFERADGTTATLADYRGRPLVVNFFGSWCGPCITEMPMLEAVHQANAGRVAFLGLNVAEPLESGMRLAAATGVTYDVASDADGEVFDAFGGVNMPTTVVIDAAGNVVQVHTGVIDRGELEGYLSDLTT